MSSPQQGPVGGGAPPDDGGRDQALWETLEALDRLTEVTPSSGWDRPVKVLAAQVSAGLVDRLQRIEAEETVARSVPCAHPYCRYKVLVTDDGAATHIHNDGSTFEATIGLPINKGEDGVEWITHTAEPADERRQAERQAIIDSATACAQPHCNHPVAVVDGVAHHIDDTGTLFGPRISVPVPAPIHVPNGEDGEGEGEAEHWTWVRHTAEPAPGEGLGDPPAGPADATGTLEERPALLRDES